MRPNVLFVLATTVLVTTAWAGCVEELPPGQSEAYWAVGDEGRFTLGFAYDGQGVLNYSGTLHLFVNDLANTGEIVADGEVVRPVHMPGPRPRMESPEDDDADGHSHDPDAIGVHFDSFNGTQPFHDGGVVAGLREHGDSGVGNPSIPAVDLDMAGWGWGHVVVGGHSYTNPATGDDLWKAHFMVIKTGVRDDSTNTIHKANNSGVYDPATPGDGTATEGDLEIHLVMQSGEIDPNRTLAGLTPNLDADATFSTHNETKTFYVENTAIGGKLNVTVEPFVNDDATLGSTRPVSVTVTSPSGRGVKTMNRVDGPEDAFEVDALEFGEYKIKVKPANLYPAIPQVSSFSIRATAYPVEPVTLNFWWEKVTLGDAAKALVEAMPDEHEHDDHQHMH